MTDLTELLQQALEQIEAYDAATIKPTAIATTELIAKINVALGRKRDVDITSQRGNNKGGG